MIYIEKKIIDLTFQFFIDSSDYNGISLWQIGQTLDLNEASLRSQILSLIENDLVTLVCEQTNPYIKAIENSKKEVQLASIKEKELNSMCLYPTDEYLSLNVDTSDYENRPFSKMLLLGAPQLRPIYFDLFVLEPYFNDPRYAFENHDNGGSIHILGDQNCEGMHEKDQVYLETFGIGRDEKNRRVAAVFLRYLNDFSPEHQQQWFTRMRTDICRLDGDYFRSSYLGEWPEGISIYSAILQEIKMVNELSSLMGKPSLFKDDFVSGRPKQFGILLRPTQHNYDDFIQLLDKMLSDNINMKFFKRDGISFEIEEQRKDGKIIVRQKSTLFLLEEWLNKYYKPEHPEIFDEIFDPLKRLRKSRNKPAHYIVEDRYDLSLHDEQNEVLLQIFESVNAIRFVFQNYPNCSNYVVPSWYDLSKLKIY